MMQIWVVIILGVILVPLLSKKTKDLEQKLEHTKDQDSSKNKKKEDLEQNIKYLSLGILILFLIIVILMAYFTGKLFPN